MQTEAAKDPPASDTVVKESQEAAGEYHYHNFPFIQTTRKIHSTTEERK